LDIQIHAAPFKKGISAIYLKIFLIFMEVKFSYRESKVRNVGGIDPNAISKEDVIEEIIKWIKTRIRKLKL